MLHNVHTKDRPAINFTCNAQNWSSSEGLVHGGVAHLGTSKPDLPKNQCPGIDPSALAQNGVVKFPLRSRDLVHNIWWIEIPGLHPGALGPDGT